MIRMVYTRLGVHLGITAMLMAACVLPVKDLGQETDGSDACEPGASKPADDECNTCDCLDGHWACTAIACDDTGSPPSECEPGQKMLADDGCNTCACSADGYWACTQLGCVDPTGGTDSGPAPMWFGDELLVCDPGAPTDSLEVLAAQIVDDALQVTVGHGGGCAMHQYGLCWDEKFLESNPVQAHTFISHDAMGDQCEAYLETPLTFDLAPLSADYRQAYQVTEGEIVIVVDGWSETLLYTF